MHPQREVPIKCSFYFCQFVYPEFFSRTTCRKFVIFCEKVELNQIDFFFFFKKKKKGFVLGILDQRGKNESKWGYSSFVKNQHVEFFLIFCMKLQQHKVLKLTWTVLNGKCIYRCFREQVDMFSRAKFLWLVD